MKSKLKSKPTICQKNRSRWVAIGDASRFIIFEKRKGTPLSKVKVFSNEAAHLKVSDFETDQPGRTFDSQSRVKGQAGGSRHTYASKKDPKLRTIESFTKKVGTFLNREKMNGKFEKLVVVAGDRLRGNLLSALNKQTNASVSKVHAMDLAWISEPELEVRIEGLLKSR